MDVLHQRCAGLDVHKKTVMACVSVMLSSGRAQQTVREFGTMTQDLLCLRNWLSAQGVTHVAMESTGVFWKPIFNILEERFAVMLCNAQHVKQVPGRKTDVCDSQWLAQLLQHGLLRGSFIPPRPQRELRDLTRHRMQVTEERTRVANRIHKVLEDANIKLGSVASDVLGASGRAMLKALIEGNDDPVALAELARRRLRGKIPDLRQALSGHVTEHHRFMLRTLYGHLQYLEEVLAGLDSRIEQCIRSQELNAVPRENNALPFDEAVQLLDMVPGVDLVAARAIVAETGTDMRQFPTPAHLSAWTGLSPGNNESAGKRRSGKTTKGNRWLRRILVQAALAASRRKGSYFLAQYRRLASRRGKKRAAIAVAHSILIVIHCMLNRHVDYLDLGADYFDKHDPQRLLRYYKRRIEDLGYKITLEFSDRAA
jgi:transposase